MKTQRKCARRLIIADKKWVFYLLEQFRQIVFYLAKQFWQITHCFPELFCQIILYLLEQFSQFFLNCQFLAPETDPFLAISGQRNCQKGSFCVPRIFQKGLENLYHHILAKSIFPLGFYFCSVQQSDCSLLWL